jgi:cytochrome c oxidase subunit IV
MTLETAEHADTEHGHPGDKQYVVVALILAVITAVEVLTYFVDFGGAHVPSLIVMMVMKFTIVARWFMHLKFDVPIFSRVFVSGLILAGAVYVIMLTAFQYWS